MPHQLLHNLELGPSSAEQGRVCPAECVPPDPLFDAQLLRDRANVMTKKLLSPIRVLPPILRAGEHPTLRRSIGCSTAPVPQITDQVIVEGHRFLRSLCLARPDDLLHDRSNNPELFILEVDVLPLERKQFALSQSSCHIQQHHDSFPRLERRQQLPDLIAGENVRSTATLGALPHPLNGIAVVEIVAPGMVEQDAHHVPDFAAGTRCPLQMFEPKLHFDSFDVREDVVSPTRNDPFAKVALIGLLGGVRDSSVRAAKLSLLEMISQLCNCYGCPSHPDVCGIDFPYQPRRHLTGG